jgi:haloacetate dehalogenase
MALFEGFGSRTVAADGIARRAEDPLASWRPWCDDLRGRGVPGGQFLPEESPVEVGAALLRFFSTSRGP